MPGDIGEKNITSSFFGMALGEKVENNYLRLEKNGV